MKSKLRCFAVIATTISIGFSAAFAYNDKASNLQEQARRERENKNMAKAESLFLSAVKEGDKNGYSYRTNAAEELAQWYLERKEYSKAESMFKKALAIGLKEWGASNNFDYELENYTYLSKLYRAQNDYVKALASINKSMSHIGNAVSLRNDDRRLLAKELIVLSRWLRDNKREREAEELCRQAVKITVKDEDAKYHEDEIAFYRHELAKSCLATKKYSEANSLLAQVLAHRKEKFNILDWQIVGPSFDQIIALNGMGKNKEAKELSTILNRYWPPKAFRPSSKKDKQDWEDTIIGARDFAMQDNGDDENQAEKALAIAKKFGPSDIRFALSTANLATLRLQHDYKQVEPLSLSAVKSAKLALGADSSALASFLEHWGKSLENTSIIHSAPFVMYKEALAIRKKTTKLGDIEAFKGAHQIGNFCKTLFARSPEDELVSMYSDACKIIIMSKGLNNESSLNALSDEIAMLEIKYRYSRNPKDHSGTLSLYEKLLAAQSSFYGKNSIEVKETESYHALLLSKLKGTK